MADSAVVGILRVLLTADTAEYTAAITAAQATAKKLTADYKAIGQQATQLGAALTRTLTLPLAGLGIAASKAAIDFESSFAGVRKTVDATEEEFAQMAGAFRKLATEIPVNVNELNRLGEAAGALGIPKAEIVDFAKVMAMLGETTNVTSDQAAESIAKIQTVFQSAGKETDRFASTLVDLGNKGASTEQEILSLATRLASAGRAIGLSQDEVLGFASAIANVGIEAEAGGSAISRVFGDISIAVSKGGEDVRKFADTAGMSIQQFQSLFKQDAAAAVTAFIEGLGRLNKEGADLNLVLEQLGFSEIRQARALRDLALSGDNLAKSLSIANGAWRENSALTEEARKRFETTEKQITLLWNRIKDVGITLGNVLLPVITRVTDALGMLIPVLETLARGFSVLPANMQLGIVAAGAMVAALGPLLFIFGQLVTAASAVAGAFTAKGLATRALTALLPPLTVATTAQTTAATASAGASAAAAGGMTAMGVAARSLLAVLGPLAAGLGAIWGAGKIWEAGVQGLGLMRDGFAQTARAAEQQKSHQLALAEASRVTGRQITGLGEALRILADRNANLRELSRQAADATAAQGASANAAANAVKGYADQLTQVQQVVAKLTATQKADIVAGDKMGASNQEIAKSLKLIGVSADMAEAAVKLYLDSLKSSGKTAEEVAAGPFKKLQTRLVELNAIMQAAQREGPGAWRLAVEEFGDELLEAERKARILGIQFDRNGPLARGIRDAFEQLSRLDALSRGRVEDTFDIGQPLLERSQALVESELSQIDKTQAAWRDYYNWLGERRMEAEAAAMAAAKAGQSIATSLKNAFANLPQVIMSAITGGGDVGKAIGGLFGGSILSGESGLVQKLTSGLKNVFGKSIGGALGSIIPGIGTLLGSALGGLTDKLFGKLFKTEGRKVNDLRDAFISAAGGLHELNVVAHQAGLTLDRLLRADTVKEYEAAVRELNGAFQDQAADLELARQAAEEFGIPFERMGQAFKQAEIDAAATVLLDKIRALSKSGVEMSTIIEFAGDDLGRFIQRAIEAGTTVPREFKDIAQSMIEQGTLIDANGDKFTDLAQIPFAESINEQLAEMVSSLKDIATVLKNTLSGALDSAGDAGVDAFSRIREAINRIPKVIDIAVNVPEFSHELPSSPVAVEGFQHGTFRRNFGLGEIVAAHGVESIVPRHRELDFAERVLAEQNVTEQNQTNFVMVAIPLEAAGDSYRIADEVLRQWPDAARTNRAGIATAVERLWTDMHRTYGGR